MVNKIFMVRGLVTFLVLFTCNQALYAAPACKGPNKNDPGCPGTETAPAAVAALEINSVTVDWFNQKLAVRGAGLDTVATFTLGGTTLAIPSVTDMALDIPFDSTMAGVVTETGNYAFDADGTVALSVYFKSQVVDPAAGGCPCETVLPDNWINTIPRWGNPDTDCLEIVGSGTNDVADIAGTVLSDPNDPLAYPQYAVGASFQPGDPENSVCQLVQVNADATTSELVNSRINETQQEACAGSLKTNVCATTAPAP
jgi:hypothetical protein